MIIQISFMQDASKMPKFRKKSLAIVFVCAYEIFRKKPENYFYMHREVHHCSHILALEFITLSHGFQDSATAVSSTCKKIGRCWDNDACSFTAETCTSLEKMIHKTPNSKAHHNNLTLYILGHLPKTSRPMPN